MKTQNPLIGRSTKSKGADVFYTLNGQNIVRNKPMSVANPRTEAQTKQRVRFVAFTEAANSLSDTELNILFPVKQHAQNRRSTLQQQLSTAYGAIVSSDPETSGQIVPTFDASLLGDLGTGQVGYVGDLVSAVQGTPNVLLFDKATLMSMVTRLVNTEDNEQLAVVAIAEDGCTLGVFATNKTIASINAMASDDPLEISTNRFNGHGSSVNAYLVKITDGLPLIGLGTFTVAKRKATNRHNVVVD